MAAYVIVNVTITDDEQYEEYKKLTPASVAEYDGKFIVRGGAAEVLEGTPSIGRVVVLEFPNAQRAKEWWNSPQYEPAKQIRQRAATTEMILVQGVE
jgi:uncharacterized protein (DUF1330 family)